MSEFRLHYAEANYAEIFPPPNERDSREDFTEGGWDAVQVPYLQGIFQASRPRHAMIAMGADAANVDRLVSRYDPDYLTLVCPIPGVNPQIQRMTQESIDKIARNYPATMTVNINPFSVIQSMRCFTDETELRHNTRDLIFFALGTKPHSLGMTLAAFLSGTPQVVFRVPRKYAERKNTANGFSWLYNIRDLSNPQSGAGALTSKT